MNGKQWKKTVAIVFAALTSFALTACGGNGSCAHTQTENVTLVAATCTQGGRYKTVCKECKVILSESDSSSLGHSFGEWQETSAASCKNIGVKQRTCVRGCVEYEYADKLAHTPKDDGTCEVCTQTVYSLGLAYTLSADETYYTVAMGTATDEDIVIPASWENKPVKEIAAEGFAYSTTMKSITVPESIEKIYSGAFNGSNVLENVYWNPRACADFADRNWAFLRSDTAAELHITFGKNVERIPARMFFPLYNDTDRIPQVTEVVFEEGSKLQSVGDYAFYQTPIKEISLPSGLQSIGAYAFADTSLTAVSATGLTDIGDYAFCNCQDLVSVQLGGELQTFGTNVFDYCIRLQNADFTNVVGVLGASLFKNCYDLSKATFADGVESIPARAFYNCKNLREIRIPDSVAQIGAEAFVGCENVRSITIGENVSTIGARAFSGLKNVTELYYNAACVQDFESGNGVFESLGKNTVGVRIVLGESVTALPARFLFSTSNADSLPNVSKITLNAALVSVGDYAFFGADCSAVYSGNATQWAAVHVGANNDALANVSCVGGN